MHGIETAFIARVDTDTIEVKTSQPGKPGQLQRLRRRRRRGPMGKGRCLR